MAEGRAPACTREVSNQFALTPKIGLPMGNALVLCQGGSCDVEGGGYPSFCRAVIAGSATEPGLIIGLDAEMLLSPNINARIALRHPACGTDQTDPGTSGRWVEQDLTIDTVTVGFSVYFD